MKKPRSELGLACCSACPSVSTWAGGWSWWVVLGWSSMGGVGDGWVDMLCSCYVVLGLVRTVMAVNLRGGYVAPVVLKRLERGLLMRRSIVWS